ncbi:MAG: hypothetical protein QOE27_815 [Solirubrobacteraceae bacterium]|jgi:hypothetical protein|nr:hypothetical protein [Solirubrobacteraceae bacterium]
MRRSAATLLATTLTGLVALAAGTTRAAGTARPPAPGSVLLGLHAFGPLTLGMTRTAAVRTGWLAGRSTGCPLGGTPPITYRFTGRKAPPGIGGSAEFDAGRLRLMSFTRGVRTSTGVVVGRTTAAQMVSRYRGEGLSATARFDSTFGGTFVTVKRRGRQVIGGFATRGPIVQLAIPSVPVCE